MKSRTTASALLAVATAALAVMTVPAHAAPGQLDAAFGDAGRVIIDLGGEKGLLKGVAVQADGGIVAAGRIGDGDALVVRLTARGALDTTFGVAGVRRLDLGDTEIAEAVAVQPDGKIVVAGFTYSHTNGVVWRLDSRGVLDAGFGVGGVAIIEGGADEYLHDVAIDSAGRIVVAGSSGTGSSSVMTVNRLDAHGRADPTFDGEDGAVSIPSRGGLASAYGVDVQADRKIVLTGWTPDLDDLAVYRFTEAGALDVGFGTGGVATVPGTTQQGYDVRVLPDGTIAALGVATARDADPYLARFTSAGALDAGFGGSFDLGANEYLFHLDVDRAGRLVGSGQILGDGVVTRFDSAGHLDPSFGRGGVAEMPAGGFTEGALVVQPDGNIVVVGYHAGTLNRALVVRFQGDPSPTSPPAVLTCHGRKATLVGTAGKDRLRGTKKADVILALGGNDRIDGRGGDDVVCAGDGNDLVKGAAGKDALWGEGGRDRLLGGSGKDRLHGGPGRDTVRP